jgi:hypothetical protein
VLIYLLYSILLYNKHASNKYSSNAPYKYTPNTSASHQNNIVEYTDVPLRGICMYSTDFIIRTTLGHHITEIFATVGVIDCQTILKHYPHIEKLEARSLNNVWQLKQSKLKYLCINNNQTGDIIKNLPDTIESFTMKRGWHTESIFDQLSKFPHLTYLKINLPFSRLTTTLNINTVHFIITSENQSKKIE